MNKRLKNALQASFAAPQPADKERFLKTLRFPKISYRKFLLTQFCYIRKRVWGVSALIVLLGWAIAFFPPSSVDWHTEAGTIWSISAILPFLAMLTSTELYRSCFHRMAELETACRFSLPQIVMARIAVLGGGNFVILTLLLIFMSRISAYSLLQVIAYLMVPYLITCATCLWILNRVRGRENVYCCAAAVGFICVVNVVFSSTVQYFYLSAYLHYWLLLFASSGALIGIQVRNLLKQTEDRTWNLFLTE